MVKYQHLHVHSVVFLVRAEGLPFTYPPIFRSCQGSEKDAVVSMCARPLNNWFQQPVPCKVSLPCAITVLFVIGHGKY